MSEDLSFKTETFSYHWCCPPDVEGSIYQQWGLTLPFLPTSVYPPRLDVQEDPTTV